MRFELIPAESLHSVWAIVKPGLERVREHGGIGWIVEDIYAAIRYKVAALYMAYDDSDKRRGFFITEVRKAAHTNETQLNVWVLYAEPVKGDHFADVKQFTNETLEFLDTCARHVKATTITQEGRHGWSRYLSDAFKPVLVKYERKVT